ncbi:MAG: mercury transporter [Nitrosomonas sp.]|uniref:Mercuric transport protein MerT n=1 Tax=Nitrosomonas aestuarii TaxID=52441 RepID=A0A1I4FIL9_9PROT|nr:mercuric transporter MerT family protein [Nitrosomonas aestuarii]MBX3630638.1 mercury transporter [Nitrosomonas sp.]SFL17778.1 mercuric ion transport protein [Nitrosomonas aestuarii]
MSKKEFNLPIIGGIIAAAGAGLCCAWPFVLLLLGVNGSWISNLTLLEPYRPLFILVVFVLFGWVGWNVYRSVEECEPGSACAVPRVRIHRQIIFWVAALIALALVTSAYWIPFFA